MRHKKNTKGVGHCAPGTASFFKLLLRTNVHKLLINVNFDDDDDDDDDRLGFRKKW